MNFNQEKPRTTDNTMISDLKRHELILTSIAHSITEVEPFVDTICSELEVQEELFGNILVALTEAVNNAIHHGNELDPVKKVHVQARVDGRILTFIIRDQGPGFDYNNLPDPTSPENLEKPSGRGVFLMSQLSDLVIFSDRGSTVEVQFRL
jgi:serine/threonine-protein kinase RsbW